MAKIPFYFPAPTPIFFRDKGLFKNPKNKAFVDWCFEKCSPDERIIFHDNQKIVLKPYQFIFGRKVCSEETGLTEDEVRTQQERWEKLFYLKKIPNKTPKRFTVYEWVLAEFLKNDPQQNPQQTPNKPPTNPHNQEDEKKRSKEDHHLSSSSNANRPDDDLMTDDDDDFSLNSKIEQPAIEKQKQHNGQTKTLQIEVLPGVFLSRKALDECIAIKGNLEAVKFAMQAILDSPKRNSKISNWPTTLQNWHVRDVKKPRRNIHEQLTRKLEKDYGNHPSWRCEWSKDSLKDITGILFYPVSAVGNPTTFFVSHDDPEFETKVSNLLSEKKMR